MIISKDQSINAVISKSSAVIHSSCTTGLESALAGVKTINILPQNNNYSYTDHISSLVSIKCFNSKEVIEAINDKSYCLSQNVSNLLFGIKSKEPAAFEVIANTLLRDAVCCNIDKISFNFDTKYKIIKNKVTCIIRGNYKYVSSKFDSLSFNEVYEKVSILADVVNFKDKIKIIKIYEDVFELKNY